MVCDYQHSFPCFSPHTLCSSLQYLLQFGVLNDDDDSKVKYMNEISVRTMDIDQCPTDDLTLLKISNSLNSAMVI